MLTETTYHLPSGFIEAIRQHPEDDAVRLIAADWLDEQDQPERAEFIRLQVECAQLPPRHWVMAVSCEKDIHREGQWMAIASQFPRDLQIGNSFTLFVNGEEFDPEIKPQVVSLHPSRWNPEMLVCLKDGGQPDQHHRRRHSNVCRCRSLIDSRVQGVSLGSLWIGTELYNAMSVHQGKFLFNRGFLNHISAPAGPLFDNAHLLFPFHPITRVVLQTIPEPTFEDGFYRLGSLPGSIPFCDRSRKVPIERVTKLLLRENFPLVQFDMPEEWEAER